MSKPYGSRITNLRHLDGTPIQMDETLTLGMNAYRMDALVAKGGALEGRKFEKLWTSKAESAYGETAWYDPQSFHPLSERGRERQI